MITDSFDDKSEAIVTPESFFGERKHICDTAIVTFSREIFEEALAKYPNEQVSELGSVNKIRPIYLLDIGGMKAILYISEMGSAQAATDFIEVNWKTGADKFILLGSCGALDNEKTAGKYIIPTEAYRDEGMSYHYALPSDYIAIKNAGFVADFFASKGYPYTKGRVWTTDALYMETREKVRKRKEEGCIAVEMELAGVQAVCNFHGFELYDFIVAGDVVDQPDYTPDGLHEANHSFGKFGVAVELAKKVKEI
jgi:uridine phosphorylase